MHLLHTRQNRSMNLLLYLPTKYDVNTLSLKFLTTFKLLKRLVDFKYDGFSICQREALSISMILSNERWIFSRKVQHTA